MSTAGTVVNAAATESGVLKKFKSLATRFPRGAKWVVGLGAAALVLTSVGRKGGDRNPEAAVNREALDDLPVMPANGFPQIPAQLGPEDIGPAEGRQPNEWVSRTRPGTASAVEKIRQAQAEPVAANPLTV